MSDFKSANELKPVRSPTIEGIEEEMIGWIKERGGALPIEVAWEFSMVRGRFTMASSDAAKWMRQCKRLVFDEEKRKYLVSEK